MESEERLDPRVQVELEKLNKTSEEINNLELDLDHCRSVFRQLLTDSTQQLNGLSKKLGSCIDKARPYYEARVKSREAQLKTQDAALRYERACSQLVAAKEMVTLAEEGFFNNGQPFDPAWQEMLNHATVKVNEAEKEKIESEYTHMETATQFNDIDKEVKLLQKDLKRNINKSRPYFDQKSRFSKAMEDQKHKVDKLERHVAQAKRRYAETLRSLEQISAEIHLHREEARVRGEMGGRGSGVGAECPTPPPNQVENTASPQGRVENADVDREHTKNLEVNLKQNHKPHGEEETKDMTPIRSEKATVASTKPEVEQKQRDFIKNTVPSAETLKLKGKALAYPQKHERKEVKTMSSAEKQEPKESTLASAKYQGHEELKVTSSPVLKRMASYEEALDLGVTEATRKHLMKAQRGPSRDDLGNPNVSSQGNTSKKLTLGERLFEKILGTSLKDQEDGSSESVCVISERVVEMKGDSEDSNTRAEDRSELSTARFTIGGGNNEETKENFNIPEARLPSDIIQAPETLWKKPAPLKLDLNDCEKVAPRALPEILTPDENSGMSTTNSRQVNQLNSEVMDALQRGKDLSKQQPFLRPSRSSGELLEDFSDSGSITGSMSSMNMLDDDQIHGVMVGFQEMEEFAKTFNGEELESWRQMTLPAKLSYMEDNVNLQGLRGEKMDAGQRSSDLDKESCQLTIVNQKTLVSLVKVMDVGDDRVEKDTEACRADGVDDLVEESDCVSTECVTSTVESTHL